MTEKTKTEIQIFMQNVAWLRKKNGLTKKEMAEILGISVFSLNKIEKGVFPPRVSVEVVFRIYDRFRVNPVGQFAELLK